MGVTAGRRSCHSVTSSVAKLFPAYLVVTDILFKEIHDIDTVSCVCHADFLMRHKGNRLELPITILGGTDRMLYSNKMSICCRNWPHVRLVAFVCFARYPSEP
jgi:hypothetical protein